MTIEENVADRKEAESLFLLMLELVKEDFHKLSKHGRVIFHETAHAHFEMRVNQIKSTQPKPDLSKMGTQLITPLATPRKQVTTIANEQNKLVRDAMQSLENLIETCETTDFPLAGEDFADSVAKGARSMLETIEEQKIVTPKQERAIDNWTDGIERWLR